MTPLLRLLGIAAVVLMVTLASTAQEPESMGTNELTDAEVLARLGELIQAAGSGQTEDMAPAPGQPPSRDHSPKVEESDRTARAASSSHSQSTNGVQNSSRSSNEDKRSRSRRSSRSRPESSRSSSPGRDYSGGSDRISTDALTRTNTGPGSLDYSAFRIIVERNIFDPNRYPRQSRPATRPPTHVDSLTLVGTMSYEKGDFAFFDGSGLEYKKALKLSDRIAGYKLTNITPTAVSLASGTNELKLGVGMQLRREEDGPWHIAGQAASYVSTPGPVTSTTTPGTNQSSGSGGADDEVIKRLMQRRQQD